MPSILLFLVLSQAAPPQDYVGKLPTFSFSRQRPHIDGRTVSSESLYADRFSGTCFTMRSYVFARQDGNAPVLVATSTCTPASALRMEQSKHRHGRLVLLDAPLSDQR